MPTKPRTPAKIVRCHWAGEDPLYIRYHDEEWGVPVHDDRKLFEFLVLESAQAGLSWITVLRKRENYRQAFAGFDPVKVARFGEKHVETLMQNAGIIRNLAKIRAAINNAQRFLEIQKEFGSFDRYVWGFVGHKTIRNYPKKPGQIPATSEISDALAKDMKARGFKFLGSTVLYAHMQATGMVNDHLAACHCAGTSKAKAPRRAPKTAVRRRS
jgi:DNA-3-methyladenine glycosylase I